MTLGRLALLDASGETLNPISKRKRKLALLAYLALARRGTSRDQMVEMFWGSQDEQRARHSLSDALSELRGHLGADAIKSRTDDLALDPAAPLTMDAREFAAACDAKDWDRATRLYGGPFLGGVSVEDSSSFEDWVTRERDRLAQLFARACRERLAVLRSSGDWAAARSLAERWLDAAPLSADAALALMEAVNAPRTVASAQEAHAAYQRLVARLLRDYDMEPDPRVAAFASSLAEQASAATAVPAPPSAPQPPVATGPSRRRWIPIGIGVAMVAAIALLILGRPHLVRSARPVVAVIPVRSLSSDTATAWLEEGLTQMITADLSRNAAVDVVAPERVRAVLARGALQGRPTLTDAQLRGIANDVGAAWIVTGAFTHGENIYVLDISLHDVASGKLTRLYTVTGADPASVSDAAAARVLDAADANGPGPRFAALETSSLEAYQHFMRWQLASQTGHNLEASHELDEAVRLDSGFTSALVARMRNALFENDKSVVARLRQAWQKAQRRATPWDVQEIATVAAVHGGQHERAEALGRQLVASFPRDPRAYALLASIYQNHGRWDAADTVLERELTLDSLATEAGSGPCAPCTAYSGLIDGRLAAGRLAQAEQAGRRWVALQPDIPSSWTELATALALEGRYDEAFATEQRAAALAPDDPDYTVRLGRILLMARRYHAVDSMLAAWRRSSSSGLRENAEDLQALLERERGQYRASIATIGQLVRDFPADGVLLLEQGNSYARIGKIDDAHRIYHDHTVPVPAALAQDLTPGSELAGDQARAFSWVRALDADAIGDKADTTKLRALADSIERFSRFSYYGRDWGLAFHVRGIIAERGGRHAEAAEDFEKARWGLAGWTRTNARLAEALTNAGRPGDAVAVLRDAYAAPLDAMGRYQPRTETDYLMSLAFARAGQRDSAAVYAARVREAWSHADPEVRARLLAIP